MPNPTSGAFVVQFDQEIEAGSITLFDLAGRMVSQSNITNVRQWAMGEYEVLTPGIYLLRIDIAGKTSETHKLVIH